MNFRRSHLRSTALPVVTHVFLRASIPSTRFASSKRSHRKMDGGGRRFAGMLFIERLTRGGFVHERRRKMKQKRRERETNQMNNKNSNSNSKRKEKEKKEQQQRGGEYVLEVSLVFRSYWGEHTRACGRVGNGSRRC